jgi:hypothetical protein
MIVAAVLLYPRIFLTKEAVDFRIAKEQGLDGKGCQPSESSYVLSGFVRAGSAKRMCP